MKIHVVMASVDYAEYVNLVAFNTIEEANGFITKCDEYDKTRPMMPESNKREVSEDEWEYFNKLEDEWRVGHPGGERASYAEGYRVSEIELKIKE